MQVVRCRPSVTPASSGRTAWMFGWTISQRISSRRTQRTGTNTRHTSGRQLSGWTCRCDMNSCWRTWNTRQSSTLPYPRTSGRFGRVWSARRGRTWGTFSEPASSSTHTLTHAQNNSWPRSRVQSLPWKNTHCEKIHRVELVTIMEWRKRCLLTSNRRAALWRGDTSVRRSKAAFAAQWRQYQSTLESYWKWTT